MPYAPPSPLHAGPRLRTLAALTGAVLAAAGCGGGSGTEACTPRAGPRVPRSTAVHDTAFTHATRHFGFASTPGTRYAIALVGLTDSATALTAYADGCLRTLLAGAPGGRSPQEALVTAPDSVVWFTVTPDVNASPPTRQVILVSPVPDSTTPQAETATVAPETPTVGQVATRQTSAYAATGLVPGIAYTVSVTAATGDVEFRMYTDSTRSMQLGCTQTPVHLIGAPQECTATAGSAPLYFSVASGSLNRNGARYVILVSRR